ncbi:MAG: dTDP-4-dehydrorhamnose reductase [Rickettsiales bacterium]|nr:dTDP-4-dehydrorhamnose reductase [Rickettsiales bacterium]
MKNILIIGADGMFGKDAAEFFTKENFQVFKTTRADFDITNFSQVENFFNNNSDKKIDFIINAAAYTKVDEAQTNQDLAFAVNALGAQNIAKISTKKNIPLIYISTDYVFDGEKKSAYLPHDKTNPINIYGASKLLGEEKVRAANPRHYIIRTSWLYGKHGKNFVDTMLKISQNQKVIKVVNDQFGCPTWTIDLALGIKNLITSKADFGTYHICGAGFTTWFGFAKKIFEISKIEIEVLPVSTAEFLRPAPRPKFSVLDNCGSCRHWQEALAQYLK